jgi:hypothetical protein
MMQLAVRGSDVPEAPVRHPQDRSKQYLLGDDVPFRMESKLYITVEESPDESPAEEAKDPLQELFDVRARWWREGTEYVSSPKEIAAHDAYREIILMGPRVIPYILRDLRDNGGDWYIALRALTGGFSPVPPDVQTTNGVIDAWVRWGREQQLID